MISDGANRREIGLGGCPVEERRAARAALVAMQRRGLTIAKAVENYLAALLGALPRSLNGR